VVRISLVFREMWDTAKLGQQTSQFATASQDAEKSKHREKQPSWAKEGV
jgi:hypothetical protein